MGFFEGAQEEGGEVAGIVFVPLVEAEGDFAGVVAEAEGSENTVPDGEEA